MPGAESNSAFRLFGLDPNSTHAANQRERIVPDDLAGAFDCQNHCSSCKRARPAELVGYAKDNSRRVDAVANQFEVVGLYVKVLISAFARECLCNYFLAADVALDS